MTSTTGGEDAPKATDARNTLRVLCVDDDDGVRKVIRTLLELAGHSVDQAADGSAALQCCRDGTKSFDVLVTDHEMPNMDGLELIARLRGSGFAGKIVVHSSTLTTRDDAAYRALAVNAILSKPVPAAVLLSAVEQSCTEGGATSEVQLLAAALSGDETQWAALQARCRVREVADVLARLLEKHATTDSDAACAWADVLADLHPGLVVNLPPGNAK